MISCFCSFCDSFDVITYNYVENLFYLGGSSILKTTDGNDLYYASTDPVTIDSINSIAVGNGAILILSENAIISASLSTVQFEDVCNS